MLFFAKLYLKCEFVGYVMFLTRKKAPCELAIRKIVTSRLASLEGKFLVKKMKSEKILVFTTKFFKSFSET